MNLVKITDLTKQLGLSSRTLRYYEQAGLIQSVRPQFERYRYYDRAAIERIKQIIVLRKMQISIRDIVEIYESEDMTTLVSVFVNKLHEIDGEVTALNELKAIINDFLRAMRDRGIEKISALPILYEEMDRQLSMREEISFERLAAVSERLAKPSEISIIDLPPMRVLSSKYRGTSTSDPQEFYNYMSKKGIPFGLPGRRELYEYQNDTVGTVIIQRIAADLENDGPFEDYLFEGGLFAVCQASVDEDLAALHKNMIKRFDDNKYYEIDYLPGGGIRHETLVESLLSLEARDDRISVYLAVKRRLPDVSLYAPGEQLESITVPQIEEANPILWEQQVPPEDLVPEPEWCYFVNDQGLGEYKPVIDTHKLSTGVQVALPFRVDIEFSVDMSSASYGYGADEGNLCFEHDSKRYCINKGNYSSSHDKALSFAQPIFGDGYHLPEIGGIDYGQCNKLTWIIGQEHFAVIVNGEVRYCGIDLPYMNADWRWQEPHQVIIAANGTSKRLFRSIRVSQLKQTVETKIKEGALAMMTRQSNNRIPNIHRLIQSDRGENYWFNGCAKYVMECLGELDYDFWFFAGLTGDTLAQTYSKDGEFLGDGVMDFVTSGGSVSLKAYFENLFESCGYAATFVDGKELRKNTQMYLQTLMAYIDKSIPVILYGYGETPHGVFVGYEGYGETLLYITGDKSEPERMPLEVALGKEDVSGGARFGWIFVGEKKEQKDLKQIYRDVILNLPRLLTTQTEKYCFGAEAFRAWAEDIEKGRFDDVKLADFDSWSMYTSYVCNLATNASCCYDFFDKALALNPDFTFIEDICAQYSAMRRLWNDNDGKDLEALGGGFNVTLEALQNSEKRTSIAQVIRKFADCMDEIVRILQENLA